MRNRLLLLGLTITAWLALTVIDFVLPWPAICVLLSATLLIMICHTFWLLHAQRSDRRKLKVNNAGSTWRPSVDILIPAKNESRVIERTVRGFAKLDYPDFKIWVIDDASDDQTPEILERLKQEIPNFEYS